MNVGNEVSKIRDDMINACDNGMVGTGHSMELRARFGAVRGMITENYVIANDMTTIQHVERLERVVKAFERNMNPHSRVDSEILRQLGITLEKD